MCDRETTGDARWDVTRNAVSESDGYERSVAGVDIEAIRTGLGTGPNHVLALTDARFTLSSCKVGFPMRSHTTVGEQQVILACVTRAPVGSRWCEMDLHAGDVIVYGPGAAHTGMATPGFEFSFAIMTIGEVQRIADESELHVRLPPPGQVHKLAPTAASRRALAAIPGLATAAHERSTGLESQCDEVAHAMVQALGDPDRFERIGATSRIDSRDVVHECIGFAGAVARIPSISELCKVAHVSERRLREAFADEFAMPPTLYFRDWALDECHRRLRAARPDTATVTGVAADMGFAHLGRFSGYYRELYGECPSSTLRSVAS